MKKEKVAIWREEERGRSGGAILKSAFGCDVGVSFFFVSEEANA